MLADLLTTAAAAMPPPTPAEVSWLDQVSAANRDMIESLRARLELGLGEPVRASARQALEVLLAVLPSLAECRRCPHFEAESRRGGRTAYALPLSLAGCAECIEVAHSAAGMREAMEADDSCDVCRRDQPRGAIRLFISALGPMAIWGYACPSCWIELEPLMTRQSGRAASEEATP